ncbi:alpha/beta fold hydrolase [Parafrigoribacterium soli]|uniref:alpha/beta fold hydrolase n=1 Tax=Parafrigoribacterium soli TaxID=3144663 RepID=UPI0032EFDE06
MTDTTIELSSADSGTIELSYSDQGTGHTFLLLHGGGGPLTIAGFAGVLATERDARVITPVHPGFGGTARPDALSSIRQLAAVYVTLLEALDLSDVTVVGNSIGGWIAAEIALLASPRVGRVVLVDAVGIKVEDHPVADFFSLSFPELAELSYYAPDAFRIDPSTMSPEQLAVMAGNRAALAAYSGEFAMADPGLRERLASVAHPTLVVWGDSDGIVDPEYGRAYAAAIPSAQFEELRQVGHLPQLEAPQRLLESVWRFAAGRVTT